MFARELRVSGGTKLGAIVLGTALLVVVGVFLAFGFVLLLALAAAGLLLGIGAAMIRRLTGRPPPQPPPASRHGLDPALEVAPPSDSPTRKVHLPGGTD
ncbi:hypothetical protein BH23GEM1_BH23GEM1_11770 [soil metagenome]